MRIGSLPVLAELDRKSWRGHSELQRIWKESGAQEEAKAECRSERLWRIKYEAFLSAALS